MFRIGMIILMCIGLAGCFEGTIQTVSNQYHVVLAPESMYNCPVIKTWPSVKTLTDLQVAKQLVKLAENNKICRSSMDAIHTFYNNAAKKFEMTSGGS